MTQPCVNRIRASKTVAISATLCAAIALGGCAGMGGVPKDFRGGYKSGDKVLLMLPAGERIGKVSKALRDGVMAANGADDTGARPEIELANVHSPADVDPSYDKGVEAGATQVIGPLTKPSVDSLAARESLPVTTLALNEKTTSGKPPANLFQFSLSPEDEGESVAQAAHAQGLTRALIIYPDNRGGKRRADGFRREWKILKGTIVAETSFGSADVNPAASVSRLLAAGDADFVFLAGDEEQAVQLYPEVRKAAGTLPVIASGSVYSGENNAARDRTLAGLYFVDMPWMLGVAPEGDPLKREDVKALKAQGTNPVERRLYAMGIDAYRMAPRVARMAAEPSASFPGQTGRLSVDFMGRIKRELQLARFTDEGPVPAKTIEAGTVGQRSKPEPASKG